MSDQATTDPPVDGLTPAATGRVPVVFVRSAAVSLLVLGIMLVGAAAARADPLDPADVSSSVDQTVQDVSASVDKTVQDVSSSVDQKVQDVSASVDKTVTDVSTVIDPVVDEVQEIANEAGEAVPLPEDLDVRVDAPPDSARASVPVRSGSASVVRRAMAPSKALTFGLPARHPRAPSNVADRALGNARGSAPMIADGSPSSSYPSGFPDGGTPSWPFNPDPGGLVLGIIAVLLVRLCLVPPTLGRLRDLLTAPFHGAAVALSVERPG